MFKYLIILGLCCASVAHAAIQVSSAQLTTSKKMTRLVLESSQPIAHSTANLSAPARLLIDLKEVKATPALKMLRISKQDAYFKSVHISTPQKQTTRLVFELKAPVKAQVIAVGPLKRKLYRLTFEFYPSDEKPVVSAVQRPPPVAAPRQADVPVVFEPRNTPLAASAVGRNEPLVIRSTPTSELLVIKPVHQEEVQNAPLVIKPSSTITFESSPDRESPAPSVSPRLAVSRDLHPRMTFHDETSPRTTSLKLSAQLDPVPARASRTKKSSRVPRLKMADQFHEAPATMESPPETTFLNRPVEDAFPSVSDNVAPVQGGRHVLLIALDAGHGGVDPGATGYYGSNEKNVTLSIARQVKALLAETPNMRGVLTRTGDFYIPLAERVERAHQANADLFVSIHADAFINTSARGSSVYTLSKNGASSSAASWLANKENSADLIGGVNFVSKDQAIMRTLFDLSQTATVKDSQKLAGHVLKELSGINELHRGKVERAGFAVLKSPKMPSILIETAFISNPSEESRLNDFGYQAKLARAIVAGIQRYFAHYPALARDKLARNE